MILGCFAVFTVVCVIVTPLHCSICELQVTDLLDSTPNLVLARCLCSLCMVTRPPTMRLCASISRERPWLFNVAFGPQIGRVGGITVDLCICRYNCRSVYV